MELSTESLEAACKLAYELGQQRAENDWDLLIKESSWRQLGSEFLGGVKALGRGQTFQAGRRAGQKAFTEAQVAAGNPAVLAAQTGQGGFRELASYAGRQITDPFRRAYSTFRANRMAADPRYQQLQGTGGAAKNTAGRLEGEVAATANAREGASFLQGSEGRQLLQDYGFKNRQAFEGTSRNYFGPGGALEGQAGNIAAAVGAGALGTAGIYGAGRMVAGSPQNTYVTNVTQTQPQQAPHQYYLDQLSNMFS